MKNFGFKFFIKIMMLLLTIAMIYKLGRHGDRTLDPAVAEKSTKVIPLVTLQSVVLPETPFLVDWCEGENCEAIVSKIVNCDSRLYQQADEASEIVGKIVLGEEVKGRILFTKILKSGFYVRGEKRIELVSYAGEGSWNTFLNGKWDSTDESESDEAKKTLIHPQTEAWVLIETAAGVSGFVKRSQSKSKGSCPLGLLKDQY